ncbi:MAG: hypothetical protein CL943_03025 [Candidatus Diapherotrites archaeon]|uniref:DUF3566 domain-containing protein n=1 Tax=Candidatus Iainarchaeum sp. TaxID=3101447 RepID=A0A2D6M1F1_9ARCH|nr:hypothetical protein [Candidatus Diapherotrites archaeon]|tara:strand:- start:2376 stop:2669 length:294 start_codon:yes stop_codon:yes gene_type:complete
MVTKTLTRIDPVSLGKIYAALMAGMVLIFGVIVSLFGGIGTMAIAGANGILVLLGALLVTVLGAALYGVIGFVFGAIIAWIYNLVARKVGGIKVDIA